jgi:ferredoxin
LRNGGDAVIELRVDPIACDGRGLCAELLPEVVTLDEWGYPVIASRPLPDSARALARRAVAACPMLALRLERPGDSNGPRNSPVTA